jgi:ribosome-binding protein aMBF1 (putative translation factor)
MESIKNISLENLDKKLNFEAKKMNMNFVKLLNKIIQQRNISIRELADSLKINETHLQKIFSSEKYIDIELLAKLKLLLDIDFLITINR